MKYCVYLTTYRGSMLPPFYIGFSTTENVEQKHYHGTIMSQAHKGAWDYELQRHPELFHTRILQKFATAREARSVERTLLIAANAHKNPLFINKAIGSEKFHTDGPLSKEHRLKLAQAKLGTKVSNESNRKRSETMKRIRASSSYRTTAVIGVKGSKWNKNKKTRGM